MPSRSDRPSSTLFDVAEQVTVDHFGRARQGPRNSFPWSCGDYFGPGEQVKCDHFGGPNQSWVITSLGPVVTPIYRYLLTRKEAIYQDRYLGTERGGRAQPRSNPTEWGQARVEGICQ